MDLDLPGQAAVGELLGSALPVHMEDDDIGLDLARIELKARQSREAAGEAPGMVVVLGEPIDHGVEGHEPGRRSEEHKSELQSPYELVCRLQLEKKKCGRNGCGALGMRGGGQRRFWAVRGT